MKDGFDNLNPDNWTAQVLFETLNIIQQNIVLSMQNNGQNYIKNYKIVHLKP